MPPSVFIDTNVLLDVLANRQPHYAASAGVWSAAETGQVDGFVAATSVTNVYYIVCKAADVQTANVAIALILEIFRVVPADHDLLVAATQRKLPDFEDAVQLQSAIAAGVQAIVTRNIQDFRRSPIAVMTPADFVRSLG